MRQPRRGYVWSCLETIVCQRHGISELASNPVRDQWSRSATSQLLLRSSRRKRAISCLQPRPRSRMNSRPSTRRSATRDRSKPFTSDLGRISNPKRRQQARLAAFARYVLRTFDRGVVDPSKLQQLPALYFRTKLRIG
ncbi:hypothetical protein EXN51_15080 [Agrobacterium fabrum]|uniref:Uncharacterized protein n=1 Tax=Agrobacterium fabrum (strain C58 / ATCC 33970) TaxID=176299 RepID=Q8U5U8_AGRFC|nr:hypothetical protein Atu5286 [Agrobacterium fabrum str. C58]TRB28003.1 hypothetical protein EXN51_15080 [Agrobacterium fabrum]